MLHKKQFSILISLVSKWYFILIFVAFKILILENIGLTSDY